MYTSNAETLEIITENFSCISLLSECCERYVGTTGKLTYCTEIEIYSKKHQSRGEEEESGRAIESIKDEEDDEEKEQY